jgi:hypothetical protein
MKVVTDLFQKRNIGQFILTLLFIIYLIVGYSVPLWLANFINSTLGRIVVCLVVVLFIIYFNPILSVLSVFVAYKLVSSSLNYLQTSYQTGLSSLQQYDNKSCMGNGKFTVQNQFPCTTLEQEIIQKMVPPCDTLSPLSEPASYTPFLEKTYDSEVITEQGFF